MRFSRLLVTAIVFGLALFVGPAQLAHGATLVVDSTADTSDFSTADGVCDTDDSAGDGPCTLRAAIEQANFDAGTDTIAFNIAGSGPHTISPASALPVITDPVAIDGYSQPGSSMRNFPSQYAVIKIELDGGGAGLAHGLRITAGNSDVNGLAINGFGSATVNGAGIELTGSGGNEVGGNFIGTNPAGDFAQGSFQVGIKIDGSDDNVISSFDHELTNVISGNEIGVLITGGSTGNSLVGNFIGTDITAGLAVGNVEGVVIDDGSGNTIGGPGASSSIISGNDTYGVRVTSGLATGNTIKINAIGTDRTRSFAVPNGSHGVFVEGPATSTVIRSNTIAFNGGDGVFVPEADAVTIAPNDIHSNVGLGIDLGADGVAPNDPGDVDSGANSGQNYPVLTAALVDVLDSRVQGTLNSLPNSQFHLYFYKSNTCDPSGFGEGADEVGLLQTLVTTNASGDAIFDAVTFFDFDVGDTITATATAVSANETSEFSACIEAELDPSPDSDGDGIPDATDVCPDDSSNDQDGDGICRGNGFQPPKTGDNDNCPVTPNSDQANADGDTLGDACDQCPTIPSFNGGWSIPPGDDDCDGFTTALENFVGTDPLGSCPDTSTKSDEADDQWPPDMNDDQRVNVFDVVPYIAALNSVAPGPPYTARLDLNANGAINVFDVVPFISLLGHRCAPWP